MMISLCIVVRDEAEYLASRIESAQQVVDEIIVVDAGSIDGTQKIACRKGAKVYQHPWPGDFASAYNLFLPYASGDWILNLDADELLDPVLGPSIRTLTKDNGFDGYMFTVRNYLNHPTMKWRWVETNEPLVHGAMGFRPSQSVRLFQAHPENHYSGEVHQSIRPSILAREGQIGTTNIPIHHYGLLREERISSKTTQYLNLAKRKVKSQPDNFRAWIELGLLVLNSGDQVGAMKSFYKAKSLEQDPSSAFFLGHILIEMGNSKEAIKYLKEAIRKNPDDKVVDFDRADTFEEIGRAYELLDRPKEAEKGYRLALSSRPDSPVASNNLAGLLSQRGSLKEAEDILEKLLARYSRLDMAWTNLGSNRLRSGDMRGGRTAFERALTINPKNVPARKNLNLSAQMKKFIIPQIMIHEFPRDKKISRKEIKKVMNNTSPHPPPQGGKRACL